MEQQRKVVTIPPTVSRFTASPIAAQKKRRVAAYARVSTDSDEQFTSYEAQIDYYTQYIKAWPGRSISSLPSPSAALPGTLSTA